MLSADHPQKPSRLVWFSLIDLGSDEFLTMALWWGSLKTCLWSFPRSVKAAVRLVNFGRYALGGKKINNIHYWGLNFINVQKQADLLCFKFLVKLGWVRTSNETWTDSITIDVQEWSLIIQPYTSTVKTPNPNPHPHTVTNEQPIKNPVQSSANLTYGRISLKCMEERFLSLGELYGKLIPHLSEYVHL